jgi:hypothetical protein
MTNSISRRTDIPAFYGPWFMNRVAEGFAGWENPFGGQRHLVSLAPADYHLARFAELAAALLGHVNRCIVSFVWRYANINKARADTCHRTHDPDSAFLGYSKTKSDCLVADVRMQKESNANLRK